jgi:protein-tyrosine kinase
MTALDQALIKVFRQEVAEPETPVPQPAELATVAAQAEPARSADPTGPSPPAFEPALQVDSFAWPSGCARLGLDAAEQIGQLAAALRTASVQGQRVVAITGCHRGDGCTTLLLCAARRLAEQDLRVVLVDADFDNPLLARRLGLLPEFGWEAVLAGHSPLDEVAIDSVQDRLAIVPLCGSLPAAADADDRPTPLSVLGEHSHLGLVDLGPFGDHVAGGSGPFETVVNWIDAVVLVHNVGSTSPADLERTRGRVQAAGLTELGITENFVGVSSSA